MNNSDPSIEDINKRKAFFYDRFFEAYEMCRDFTEGTIQIIENSNLSFEEKIERIKVVRILLREKNVIHCKKHYSEFFDFE